MNENEYLEVDVDNVRCICGSKLFNLPETTVYFCPECDRHRIRISYD